MTQKMTQSRLGERRGLLLYTKPAKPGGVKTRLIDPLTAEQAAAIHGAFVGDLSERLIGADFSFWVAWAVEDGESIPTDLAVGASTHRVQHGKSLGDRLYSGLVDAAQTFDTVAAIGSDHPELQPETVEDAFERLEAGADAVFGPTEDGGYYLVGLRRDTVRRDTVCRKVFADIPWSTEHVMTTTLERCKAAGLQVSLLPRGYDIDVGADLRRLADRISAGEVHCQRTHELLDEWGWLRETRR